jgi:hypothetical protein
VTKVGKVQNVALGKTSAKLDGRKYRAITFAIPARVTNCQLTLGFLE